MQSGNSRWIEPHLGHFRRRKEKLYIFPAESFTSRLRLSLTVIGTLQDGQTDLSKLQTT